MISEGAYISVRAICNQWLLKREKSIHSLWKALTYAAEGVEYLKLTSLPLPQHQILTRPAGQTWFDLPAGFQALIAVGVPFGNTWRPVAISDAIIPLPSYDGNTDLGADLGDGFNPGTQQNWNDAAYIPGPSFSHNNFAANYFNTAAVPAGMTPDTWEACVRDYHWDKTQTLTVSPLQGQIYTGRDFPYTKLYLVYVAAHTLKTMTHIPIAAKPCVLAFIDWQYEYNKRNNSRAAAEKKVEWIKAQRVLRANLNPLKTIADYKALLNWRYRGSHRGLQNDNSRFNVSTRTLTQTVITLVPEFDVTATNSTNVLTDPRISGVSRISYGGQTYNSAFFTVSGNSITLTTPGATFYPGLIVTITPTV